MHYPKDIFVLFQVYCRVCYLRAYGPGGKNKYGEANPVAMDDESAPEACVRCHSKVNFSAKSISVSRNFFFLVICDAQFSVKSISRIFLYQ